MNYNVKGNREHLVEKRVKTTPENVQKSNEALYDCTMNVPAAAKNCGMTEKEMRMTFREYLKYNPPICDI